MCKAVRGEIHSVWVTMCVHVCRVGKTSAPMRGGFTAPMCVCDVGVRGNWKHMGSRAGYLGRSSVLDKSLGNPVHWEEGCAGICEVW